MVCRRRLLEVNYQIIYFFKKENLESFILNAFTSQQLDEDW